METEMKTLIVKNFSGSFNDKYIGHEIINSFDYDDNKTDSYLFYLPPYGSIFTENNFFQNDKYKQGFEKIVIFEETGITNVLKLKAVALEPSIIDKKKYEELLAKVRYKGKLLDEIRFGSASGLDPLVSKNIYHFTYLIKKENYFNFEDDNLLIWHKSTKKRNDKEDTSFKTASELYGQEPFKLENTTIGQKNYCYNIIKVGTDFDKWFEEKVKPSLETKKPWELPTINGSSAFSKSKNYDDDNLISNLKRTDDENLYTNFIQTILLQSKELKNIFFSYMVSKLFGKKCVPSNVGVETQHQSLIEIKRAANSLIKRFTKEKKEKMDHLLKNCKSDGLKNEITDIIKKIETDNIDKNDKFINGYIDLYLEDDNYRIAIENKIYSGINGKSTPLKDIDQIKTYKKYLEDLNSTGSEKASAVVILCPESEKYKFVNSKATNVVTYKELFDFFSKNKCLIKKNEHNFLNALAYHAFSKEEIISARFLKALS